MLYGRVRNILSYSYLSLLFVTLSVSGQDQRIADSLRVIYETNTVQGEAKLELLREMTFNENRDLQLAKEYAEELIQESVRQGSVLFERRGYTQLGNAHRLLGDLDAALEAYFKARDIAIKDGSKPGEGAALMALADVYSIMENHMNAEEYYEKAISILRLTQDTVALATGIFNAGDEYFKSGNFSRALDYYQESGSLFNKLDYGIGVAYTKGNIGIIKASEGQIEDGIKSINEAIVELESYEDIYAISEYLIFISDILEKNNDFKEALPYAERSLNLAVKHDLREQIRDAHLKLSVLHERLGDRERSYSHYKQHIIFKDSLKNLAKIEEMADLRTKYEVAQKQSEVDLLNQQRSNQRIVLWATGIVAILLSILVFGMYRKNQFVQRTNKIIEAEQDRSEKLLLNILPKQTAQELKDKGKVTAKKFESVSVLFTDFVDFTKYAESLEPEQLVQGMDFYYGQFDNIINKYGLEKIKTVGDSYMCAGGVPNTDPDHAVKMVQAALEIVEFVEKAKEARKEGKTRFDIRIGINSGPLVAGVVGTNKFAYDIWGDTVNVAARMETNSEAGKINISEHTYALVREQFDCEFRGEIPAKNKGKLKMYYIKGYNAASEQKRTGQEPVMAG